MKADCSNQSSCIVPTGWEVGPLEDLVQESRGVSYGIVQPGQHAPEGVPIVRVNNLRNGRILTDEVLRVRTGIESEYARTRLQGGEILLSLVGTLGECAVVPPELAGWNVARAVAVIPLKPGIDPHWVAMCLRSASVQNLIRAWATTTVQATLNLRDVRRLPILLAPEHDRKSITEIINGIECKIDQDRRTSRSLRALAWAAFKAWFVDFEPIKAKAGGAKSFVGMPPHIFDALPVEFADSPIGPVPKGWGVRTLPQVASFLNGLALQKYPPRGDASDLPAIKIADLRKGSTDGGQRASGDIPKAYVVTDGDLLFSWSGTLEVEFWFGGRGALNQHLFKVTSSEYPLWLCSLWLRQHLPEFRAIASSKATTMGHIKRGHLDSARVCMPPGPMLRLADTFFSPLHQMYANLQLECRRLAELREHLLPNLLSGAVKVRGADEAQP